MVFSGTAFCEAGSFPETGTFCGADSIKAIHTLKQFHQVKLVQFILNEEYVPGTWSPQFEQAYIEYHPEG